MPQSPPSFSRVRARVAATFSLLLALGWSFEARAAAVVLDEAALRAAARRDGSVRVLVGVGEPSSSTHRSPAQSRASIAARQQLALDALAPAMQRGAAGAARGRRYAGIPWLALEISESELDALQNTAAVHRIQADRIFHPALAVSVPQVGADLAHGLGYEGSGATVAVLDSGIDTSHAFLSGRVVDGACYSALADCPNAMTSQLGSPAGEECSFATLGCLHGSHVGGVVAGENATMSGLAPAATLLSVQIFSMGSGGQCTGAGEDPCAIAFESDLIAGLQWVLSKKDDYAIAAVNMSLAGPTSPSAAACDMSGPALKAAVDPLVAVDIAVIAPAGNSGLSGSLSAPGCLSSVVSVGAVNASDVVASFSNSATFLDLLAPGAPVSSSVPGGGFLALSGTSMATPHVAASWALIRSVADPSTTNAEILATLASTGLPITDSFGVTKPRIETWGAVASYAPVVPIGSATPGLLALALLAAAGVGFERRSKRR